MSSTIRLRTDQIAAHLAAERLEQEGIPARVISDSDHSIGLSTTGTPLQFSVIVPSQYEARARKVLAEVSRGR